MSNPTGRNQFSKGGAGGGSKKAKGKIGPPQTSAAAARFKKAGMTSSLGKGSSGASAANRANKKASPNQRMIGASRSKRPAQTKFKQL